jgi:hypothetical protein
VHDNVKERLVSAIRDYKNAAQHISGAQHLLQALEAVDRDIQNAPNPVSQGAGVMPTQRPGSSGVREDEASPGQQAAAAASGLHIHVHTGSPPKFPGRDTITRRLQG